MWTHFRYPLMFVLLIAFAYCFALLCFAFASLLLRFPWCDQADNSPSPYNEQTSHGRLDCMKLYHRRSTNGLENLTWSGHARHYNH